MKHFCIRFLSSALALLLVFSVPAAYAQEDVPFDSMAVAAYATKHTEGRLEQLRDYVQPIDKAQAEGSLEMRLIDAIFVDGVISISPLWRTSRR